MKCVILTGGESKRMGRDKALITINGKRLIDHVYDLLRTQVNDLAISGYENYNLKLPVITDAPQGPRGPAAALYAVWLLRKEATSPGFFTVPVDTPNFPDDLCERLYGQRSALIIFKKSC